MAAALLSLILREIPIAHKIKKPNNKLSLSSRKESEKSSMCLMEKSNDPKKEKKPLYSVNGVSFEKSSKKTLSSKSEVQLRLPIPTLIC